MELLDIITLSYASLNITLQLVMIFLFYRSDKSLKNKVLTIEFIIVAISLFTIVFFGIRIIPMWTDTTCTYAHAAVMVLLEVQLALYNYVQFLRFVKPMLKLARTFEFVLFGTSAFLSFIVSYYQMGFINNVGGHGKCLFRNDIGASMLVSIVHALFELLIFRYFYHYTCKFNNQLGLSTVSTKVSELLTGMRIILATFCTWLILLAGINAIPKAPYAVILAYVYNSHFTLITFLIGLPHYWKTHSPAFITSITRSRLSQVQGNNSQIGSLAYRNMRILSSRSSNFNVSMHANASRAFAESRKQSSSNPAYSLIEGPCPNFYSNIAAISKEAFDNQESASLPISSGCKDDGLDEGLPATNVRLDSGIDSQTQNCPKIDNQPSSQVICGLESENHELQPAQAVIAPPIPC